VRPRTFIHNLGETQPTGGDVYFLIIAELPLAGLYLLPGPDILPTVRGKRSSFGDGRSFRVSQDCALIEIPSDIHESAVVHGVPMYYGNWTAFVSTLASGVPDKSVEYIVPTLPWCLLFVQ
jgi:hypothetical protein